MKERDALIQIQSIPEKIWNQLSDADNEALGMAYQALVKQTPKKLSYTPCTLRCPSCRKQITAKGCIHSNYRYCKWCGQAIDWGDEE